MSIIIKDCIERSKYLREDLGLLKIKLPLEINNTNNEKT
jgi:hypothetical protein